jgi:hypothetical protein
LVRNAKFTKLLSSRSTHERNDRAKSLLELESAQCY